MEDLNLIFGKDDQNNPTVKDDKGRVILTFGSNEQVVVGRYVDMTESVKDYIISVYDEITDEDLDKVRKFLDFEEDENAFCV